MKRLIGLGLSLVFGASLPAAAHHSLAPYNRSTERSIEGTVKAVDWSNPHVRILLLVPTADGAKLTIKYNPRRDGSMGGFFTGIVTADGKSYRTRGFGTDAPSGRAVAPRDGVL